MNTDTLTELRAKFQPPRTKCVAAKEWGIFVDRPVELLVAAKNDDVKSRCVLYSHLIVVMIEFKEAVLL